MPHVSICENNTLFTEWIDAFYSEHSSHDESTILIFKKFVKHVLLDSIYTSMKDKEKN